MGISFFVKKASALPLDVSTCDQFATAFTDESYHRANIYCNDTTLGETAFFNNLTGSDQGDAFNFVGSTGANMISSDNFVKASGDTIIEFDWYPSLNSQWNTSGIETNAQNYLTLVNSTTWSIDQGRYLYGHVRGASIRVSLNSRYNRIYTYAIDGGSISTSYASVTMTEQTWIPVKIQFDWNNGLLYIWTDDIVRINGRSFTTSIGSEFKLGLHWHSFTHSGYHAYRNIKLYYE